MALFQRQPIRDELIVPYTVNLGKQETLVIAGLGNPGDKYPGTRHNIGFESVDEIAKQHGFGDFAINKDFNALVSKHILGGNKIYLIKPQTFINLSGKSIRALLDYYKISPKNLVVIHDDLDIAFGQIRMRVGGQSAGHNGVKSVIEHCGLDFGRIRIGIKNGNTPAGDTSNFVLKPFSKEEKSSVPTLLNEVTVIATEYIYSNQLPNDTRTFIN